MLEQCLESKRLAELENEGYTVEELTEFKIIETGMTQPRVCSYMVLEYNGFKLVKYIGFKFKSKYKMGEVGETINLNAKRYYSKDGILKEVILKQ